MKPEVATSVKQVQILFTKVYLYFTSVDGTSDNGSLPVSEKVVPQAPDEEVCRFCHRQNLPNQSRGGWARVKPKVATPESII